MMTDNKEDIKYTKEQISGWEKYRDSLYVRQEKSHDLFEKAITFISSGALGLTIVLHDNIVPVLDAQYTYLIALGWLLLAATLFINLVSHYLSSKATDKTIDEIDQVLEYDLSFKQMNTNLEKRNTKIDKLNKITIWTIGLGLILVISYVTLNLFYGKATQPETAIETTKSTNTQNRQSKSERAIDSATYIPIK